MIDIKELSVYYETQTAVDEVSLQIRPGAITGLIGPNGAGKSSLIKACTGLITEFAGSIQFQGRDIRKDAYWIKTRCGYAPEDTELLPYLSGREFLELIGTIRKSPALADEIDFLLDLFELTTRDSELILNYSHGMRQKVSIAAALIGQPDYLILDEALNGLDPVSLYRLKKYLIKESHANKTILLSSHILPLIRIWCDPVVIMDRGRVIRVFATAEIDEMERHQGRLFEEIFVDLVGVTPAG